MRDVRGDSDIPKGHLAILRRLGLNEPMLLTGLNQLQPFPAHYIYAIATLCVLLSYGV